MEHHSAILGVIFGLLVLLSCCTAPSQPSGTAPQEAGGKLKANPAQLPSWISGEYGYAGLYEMVSGGSYDYRCALSPDSSLPFGLSLDGYCSIVGTITLAPGTTKSISPPFTVVVTDTSEPPQSVSLTLSVTTVLEAPKLRPLSYSGCKVDEQCSRLLAEAEGGTPPYTFSSGSFGSGAPPMGMMIDANGYLTGTPSQEGEYYVSLCVSDLTGASSCEQFPFEVVPKDEEPQEISTPQIPGITEPDVMETTLTVIPPKNGKIVTSDGKIDCGQLCTVKLKSGEMAFLDVKLDDDSWFGNWTGDCDREYGEPTYDYPSNCLVESDGKNKTVSAITYPNPRVKIATATCTFVERDPRYSSEVRYRVVLTGTAEAKTPGATLMAIGGHGSPLSGASWMPQIQCDGGWEVPFEYNLYECTKGESGKNITNWMLVDDQVYFTDQYVSSHVATAFIRENGRDGLPMVTDMYNVNCPQPT